MSALIERIAQGLATQHDAARVASLIRQRDLYAEALRIIVMHGDDEAALLACRVLAWHPVEDMAEA